MILCPGARSGTCSNTIKPCTTHNTPSRAPHNWMIILQTTNKYTSFNVITSQGSCARFDLRLALRQLLFLFLTTRSMIKSNLPSIESKLNTFYFNYKKRERKGLFWRGDINRSSHYDSFNPKNIQIHNLHPQYTTIGIECMHRQRFQ